MTDDHLRVGPDGKVAFGLKPATFVYDPPLEEWPVLPDQERLFIGDLIYRDADGRMVNPPGPMDLTDPKLFDKVTHALVGVHNGIAYVQKLPKQPASADADRTSAPQTAPPSLSKPSAQ